MIRVLAQILVGLMLFFGVLTLIIKAFREFKEGRTPKVIVSLILALLALFFSSMAFYYAYLTSTME